MLRQTVLMYAGAAALAVSLAAWGQPSGGQEGWSAGSRDAGPGGPSAVGSTSGSSANNNAANNNNSGISNNNNAGVSGSSGAGSADDRQLHTDPTGRGVARMGPNLDGPSARPMAGGSASGSNTGSSGNSNAGSYTSSSGNNPPAGGNVNAWQPGQNNSGNVSGNAGPSGNAQNPQNQPGNQPGMAQGNQNLQAPPGFVLLDERVVYLMANEPQNHFVRAVSDLAQRNGASAAQEIQIGAGYLDMQASRAQGQAKQKLTNSANELRQFAQRIDQKNPPRAQELNEAFARAELALADHFKTQAQSKLQQNQNVAAGHELESSATSFRQALVWSGQKLQDASVRAISDADQAARNLLRSGQQQGIGQPGSGPQGTSVAEGGQGAPSTQPGSVAQGGTSATGGIASGAGQNARQAVQTLSQQIQQMETQMAAGRAPAGTRSPTASER